MGAVHAHLWCKVVGPCLSKLLHDYKMDDKFIGNYVKLIDDKMLCVIEAKWKADLV